MLQYCRFLESMQTGNMKLVMLSHERNSFSMHLYIYIVSIHVTSMNFIPDIKASEIHGLGVCMNNES